MKFISSAKEIISPRANLIGLIGGFFLFISIFMRWLYFSYSEGGRGFYIVIHGTSISGGITAVGVICGLILSMGVVFLPQPKAKGIVHIAAGAIALIVFIAAIGFDVNEDGATWLDTIRKGMIIVEGLVFYIIGAIAVLVGGTKELIQSLPIPQPGYK